MELLVPSIEFFPLLLQVDSMNSQHSYIEKQLGSLEVASNPQENELDRLEELMNIIFAEEREINRLADGSKRKRWALNFLMFITLNYFASLVLLDLSCMSSLSLSYDF
jgi:hypothetical protein